ncbi:porin, partial [Burkholderia multivorans]|uniref:porin n=1 Tax=Burkholderia multivorans TaxID=87883 RepID=UPI0011B1DDBC
TMIARSHNLCRTRRPNLQLSVGHCPIFNSYSVFGRYAITPLLWVSGAYDYLAGGAIDGKDGAKYHLFNLSLDYFLSKRTDVYFMANYQIASGVDSTGQSAVASYLTITPSNTSRQLLFRMGMRHLF